MPSSRIALQLANQLGMESIETDDTDATVVAVVPPDATVTQVAEYDTGEEEAVAETIDQHIDAMEEVSEVTAAFTELDQTLDQTETVDRVGLEMICSTVRFLDSRVGVESTGLESLTLSNEAEDTAAVKATIKERIGKLIEALKRIWEKVKAAFSKFFTAIKERLVSFKARIQKLRKKADEKAKSDTPRGFVRLLPHHIDRLHLSSGSGFTLQRAVEVVKARHDELKAVVNSGSDTGKLLTIIKDDAAFEAAWKDSMPLNPPIQNALFKHFDGEEIFTNEFPGGITYSMYAPTNLRGTTGSGEAVVDWAHKVKLTRHESAKDKQESKLTLELTPADVRKLTGIIEEITGISEAFTAWEEMTNEMDFSEVATYLGTHLKSPENTARFGRYFTAGQQASARIISGYRQILTDILQVSNMIVVLSELAMAADAPATKEEAEQKAEAA